LNKTSAVFFNHPVSAYIFPKPCQTAKPVDINVFGRCILLTKSACTARVVIKNLLLLTVQLLSLANVSRKYYCRVEKAAV
jgi:hypothetical protein